MSFRPAALAIALATPSLLLAATPTAYLERANTQVSGAQIRSFSVPVTSSTGEIKYFDVTTDLDVQDGAIGPTAKVTAVPSPKKVKTTLFVGGSYTDTNIFNGNTPCTVSPGFIGGRQETATQCEGAGGSWTATWENGDIAGNKFATQLIAAGIDKTNWQGYAWGVITQSTNDYDYCFHTNDIIGTRQDGALIVVTDYGAGNTALCGLMMYPN